MADLASILRSYRMRGADPMNRQMIGGGPGGVGAGDSMRRISPIGRQFIPSNPMPPVASPVAPPMMSTPAPPVAGPVMTAGPNVPTPPVTAVPISGNTGIVPPGMRTGAPVASAPIPAAGGGQGLAQVLAARRMGGRGPGMPGMRRAV